MVILESRLKELLKLAYQVARRYTKKWDPEYQSLAHWGAFRALRTYEPERGVPLEAWVVFMVKRAIQGFWRRNNRYKTQSNYFWAELPEQTQEADAGAWDLLDKLSEFDRAVAIDYWIEGMTVRNIAHKYDVNPRRLGRYMGKLKARIWALREELES